MIRRACLGIALALACFTAGAAAHAADRPNAPSLEQPQPLSDDELSEQRAGFSVQGVDIRFGAEIRSYIGDELVMQTNISWSDGPATVQRTVSAALTPATAAALQAGLFAGSGLNLSASKDAIFVGNDGQTAFIQRTDGAILNIIANVANNVVLRQQVDAQLDLANFAPFQRDILATRIGAALSTMNGIALLGRTAN